MNRTRRQFSNGTVHFGGGSSARRGGFILLEIVVAVGLLVLGLALIGSQMQMSVDRTYETDQIARVVFLAESKLSELDTGLIVPENLDEDLEEDFGRLFPRYGWRMRIEPLIDLDQAADPQQADELGLLFIRLEILYDPRRVIDEDFDHDQAEVMQTYYTLRAAPKPLDLTADFGMEDDVAEELNEQLTNAIGGDIDVHNFSPEIFRSLDLATLEQILQTLVEATGANPSELLQLLPSDLRQQVAPLLEAAAAGDEGDSGDEGDDGTGDAGDDTGGSLNDGGDDGDGGEAGLDDGGDEAGDEGVSPSRRGGRRGESRDAGRRSGGRRR